MSDDLVNPKTIETEFPRSNRFLPLTNDQSNHISDFPGFSRDSVYSFRVRVDVDSIEESWVNNQFQARVSFYVDTALRRAFMSYLLGYTKLIFLDDGRSYIYRSPPLGYQLPGIYSLTRKSRPAYYATSIESMVPVGEPFIPPGNSATPDLFQPNYRGNWLGSKTFYKVTVLFTSLPYSIYRLDDSINFLVDGVTDESNLEQYVLKIPQPSTEFLTLPRGAFCWVDDPPKPANECSPVDGSNGRLYSYLDITYTWHQIPGVPSVIANGQNIGKVNSTSFDGYPAETLLLMGLTPKGYRWHTGQFYYDIEYKIRYAPQGHNFFLRYLGPSTIPQYNLITHNGQPDGTRVFESFEFRQLFRTPLSKFNAGD